MMKLTVNLDLSETEENNLRRILGQTDGKWPAAFEPFAGAAVEEYARMFIGQRVFTRGSDVRESPFIAHPHRLWKHDSR